MRILTILGTRPEIIRLSGVIRLLDQYCEHILVNTDQNYDERLGRIFFDDLNVREPDEQMGVRAASFAGQIGQILERSEALFLKYRPDRLLILGDTNSALSAIIARRLGIPVYHMEAGNRCFDDRVPEEVNRRVIDHCSTVLMPYTHRSRENLLVEGISGRQIYVTGNPIKEVMDTFKDRIEASRVLQQLDVEPRGYFLATMHRAENVDREDRLRDLLEALAQLRRVYDNPIIVSLHPRTKSKVEKLGFDVERLGLRLLPPFGFFDFVHLERSAFCILSDSGTVQEEACILGAPNVTIREVTERQETVECGSNVLGGTHPDTILNAVRFAVARNGNWSPPEEYMRPTVAQTVCSIVLGCQQPDAAELKWKALPAVRGVSR